MMFNLSLGDNLRLKNHDTSDQILIKYLNDFDLKYLFSQTIDSTME